VRATTTKRVHKASSAQLRGVQLLPRTASGFAVDGGAQADGSQPYPPPPLPWTSVVAEWGGIPWVARVMVLAVATLLVGGW
jgi:hypothetical protein